MMPTSPRHPSDQVFEALAMIGSRPAHAEIGVDHVDIGLMPTELAGALLQRILQTKAPLFVSTWCGVDCRT
jgi:hypothetical protein